MTSLPSYVRAAAPKWNGTNSEVRPRIVYWNNIPTPYVQERFNALARRGNVEFEAWFNAPIEPGRSWRLDESTWEFQYRYLPKLGGRFPLALPVALLNRTPPDLLISLYADASFLLGTVLSRARKIPHAYYVEKTFDAWITRKAWKESLKKILLPRATGILAAGPDAGQFARRYGVSAERIHEVPNVTNVSFFSEMACSSRADRESLRKATGVAGFTFLYVGRLWWGKGLDFLVDAFASLKDRYPGEVSLLIVGDGPEEKYLRARCERGLAMNVVFLDFIQKPDLPRIYAMADAFVFPTLGDPYGLVVDEAMACGLPVISTSAAGEIGSRIVEGVTGFIVPPRRVDVFADRMESLARNPTLASEMGKRGFERISTRTPDLWADCLERAVDQILSGHRADVGGISGRIG